MPELGGEGKESVGVGWCSRLLGWVRGRRTPGCLDRDAGSNRSGNGFRLTPRSDISTWEKL